jgi:hypothetical protein
MSWRNDWNSKSEQERLAENYEYGKVIIQFDSSGNVQYIPVRQRLNIVFREEKNPHEEH